MHAKLTALLAAVTAVYAPAATFAQGPAAATRMPPSYSSGFGAVGSGPPGVVMNLRQFEIPFSVDSSGARPLHVELFVSRDQGQQWELFARQPASGRNFQFNAPDDGHYWFATRTIDVAGNSHPPGNRIAPQLHVTVDTTRPQLTVKADVDATGRVRVNFVYADAAPAANEVQIQYMTDTHRTEWVPVEVPSRSVSDRGDGTRQGQVEFLPAGNWRYLNVRLVAFDQAGNQSDVVEQVERPRIAGTPAHLASNVAPAVPPAIPPTIPPAVPPTIPPARMPQVEPPASRAHDGGYAMVTPPPAGTTGPAPAASAPAAAPAVAASPAVAAGPTPNPYVGGYAGTDRNANQIRGLAPENSAAPVPQLPPSSSVRAVPVSQPVPPSSVMRPISIETLPTPAGEPDTQYPTRSVPPAASAFNPPAVSPSAPAPYIAAPPVASDGGYRTSRPDLQDDPGAVESGNFGSRAIDESEIRQSRSRQFSLDYEVESVGSKGIDEVELWGTSDGGRTWSNWGADPDRQSPFDIETVNSGLYGFCIVVVGGNGLTSRRPQSGDEADIYVRVDDTAPEVQLLAARYGEGDEAGALVIEYSYRDDNPASRPVTLAFSSNPDGPWTTIATGLDAAGRYAWPADPRLPREIFLRIEGVDRAGNVGVQARDTPVAVQGLAPKARIRGFQPIAK